MLPASPFSSRVLREHLVLKKRDDLVDIIGSLDEAYESHVLVYTQLSSMFSIFSIEFLHASYPPILIGTFVGFYMLHT